MTRPFSKSQFAKRLQTPGLAQLPSALLKLASDLRIDSKLCRFHYRQSVPTRKLRNSGVIPVTLQARLAAFVIYRHARYMAHHDLARA